MGSNKKPKLSLAEQVRAAAEKVTPADPSKETVEVMVGGVRTPIVRGDMTDAAWAKVKAHALAPQKEMMLPVEVSADRPPSKLTEDDNTKQPKTIPASSIDAIANDIRNVSDTVISPEEKDLLRSTDPQRRVKFIRERLKERGYEVTDSATPVPASLGLEQRDQGTPDEWKSPEPEMKKTGGTQTEDDQMVGARPGSVQGRMAAMAMGATPPQSSNDTPNKLRAVVDPNATTLTPDQQRAQDRLAEMDANVARVNAQGDQHGQEDLARLEALNNTIGNIPKTIDDTLTGAMKPANDFVMGDVRALKQLGPLEYLKQTGQNMGQAIGPGQATSNPAPVPAPAAPDQPPVPVEPPPGGVSMSAKIPGSGSPPTSTVEDPTGVMRKEAELQAEALRLQAGNAQEKLKADANVLRTQQVERARLDADRQKELVAEQETLSKHEAGLRDLQAQVLDLSKQSVNPNLFYDSMDTGQRVSGIIAGALFGFTGQGMQWLQRLDSLAERSVQQQAAELNRKRGLLSDATQLQNNLVALAERKGLQSKAAYDASVIALKENVASQLEQNAMNFAQPDLKLKAQTMASQIRQSMAKDIASFQMQTQKAALDARKTQAEINHLNASTFKLATSAGSGEPLPGMVSKRLDESFRAYQNVKQMAKLAQNSGMWDRLKRGVEESPLGSVVSGGQEKANLDQYEQLRTELMKNIAAGALQRHEVDMLQPITGGQRSSFVDAAPTTKATAERYRRQLVTTLKAERAAGRDISQYEQMLSDMDAEDAPLSTERPVK